MPKGDFNKVASNFGMGVLQIFRTPFPRNFYGWLLWSANEFFRTNIHHKANFEDVNSKIRDMQNTIYNYFSETHGSVKDGEKNLFDTDYRAMSKNELKRQLKTLNNQIPQPEGEITYFSKLLRHKFKKRKNENNFDHQVEYYKNFWKCCEKILEPETEKVKPNFSETDCVHNFRNILKLKNKHKRFTRSLWVKEFENPTTDFNMQPPTHVEVTKVIMKMKSSAPPCLLDQISVITFKKCPVLRSRLTNILQVAWTAKTFLDVWKSGVTVLAYEKGDAGNLVNFRPITLQPALLIVFTSIMRNKIFNLLRKIDTLKRIFKKGFGRKYQAVSNPSNVYCISQTMQD